MGGLQPEQGSDLCFGVHWETPHPLCPCTQELCAPDFKPWLCSKKKKTLGCWPFDMSWVILEVEGSKTINALGTLPHAAWDLHQGMKWGRGETEINPRTLIAMLTRVHLPNMKHHRSTQLPGTPPTSAGHIRNVRMMVAAFSNPTRQPHIRFPIEHQLQQKHLAEKDHEPGSEPNPICWAPLPPAPQTGGSCPALGTWLPTLSDGSFSPEQGHSQPARLTEQGDKEQTGKLPALFYPRLADIFQLKSPAR